MSILPSFDTNADREQEQLPILSAYHKVLTTLVKLATNELGMKRTRAIIATALYKTGFSGLSLTPTGFDLSRPMAKEQFRNFPSQQAKQQAYEAAVRNLYEALHTYLQHELITEHLHRALRYCEHHLGIIPPLGIPAADLQNSIRTQKKHSFIEDVGTFNYITGLGLFFHFFIIGVLLIITNQAHMITPGMVPFLILVLCYIYVRYFTTLGLKLNGASLTSFMMPIALLWLMVTIPRYAPLFVFLLFTLITPIALLYSRRRLAMIFLLVSLAIYSYFVLYTNTFTLMEGLTISFWLTISFLLYAYRDVFVAKQLISQFQEHKELRRLAQHMETMEEELLAERLRIAAQRDQLRAILTSIADAVIAVDKDKRIILANTQAQSLLQASENELLQNVIDSFFVFHDKDHAIDSSQYLVSINQPRDQVIYQGKSLQLLTVHGSSPSQVSPKPNRSHDKVHFVDVTVSTIAQGDKIGLGAIITLHDVTKEKELADLHLDIVSIAAHELKTPLTALKGYLQVIKEELHGSLKKSQSTLLLRMETLSNQLLTHLDNMLAVAKIEHETLVLHKEGVSIEDVAEKVVDDFSMTAADKHVSLLLSKSKKALPVIFVDKLRIYEVITNLTTNALKHTPAKGHITITVHTKDDHLVISVEDDGEGIPPEALPKLFSKYYQADPQTQTQKGVGLGLYISKEIIAAHGGTITVASELEKGSTFTVTLPLTSHIEDTTQSMNKGKASTPHRMFSGGNNRL